MHPFNRQHRNNVSSTSRQSAVPQHGRPGVRERSGRGQQRGSESEPPSPTHTNQRISPAVTFDSANVLRAKEKILLSSLKKTSDPRPVDNKRRLGPNTEDVFRGLHQKTLTSSRSFEIPRQPSQEAIPSVTLDGQDNNTSTPTTPQQQTSTVLVVVSDFESDNLQASSLKVDSDRVLQDLQTNTDDSNPKNINGTSAHDSDNKPEETVSKQKVSVTIELMTSGDDEEDEVSDGHDDDDVVCKPHPPPPSPEPIELPAGVPTAISLSAAIELKRVVLGSATSNVSSVWKQQGLVFNSEPKLRYGLVHSKGCTSAVVAPLQAFLLRALLFEAGSTSSSTEPLRPTRSEVRAALVRAIGELLWRAGRTQATLALCSEEGHFAHSTVFQCDGVTERLVVTRFTCRQQLEEAVRVSLDHFTTPAGPGCLLLVYSVVLSRGPSSVLEDMDEACPLIGPKDGHCSLELVTLLLTGRAVSNLFDNTIQSSTYELRGVSNRGEVGFLSLAEYRNVCEVGSYLKTPRVPVWVVSADRNYSVLFSCRRELVSDWRAEKRFHLYFHDGRAGRKDEVKLTIDTTGLYLEERSEREVVPPVELCIRTKWKDAVVSWNEHEPIL